MACLPRFFWISCLSPALLAGCTSSGDDSGGGDDSAPVSPFAVVAEELPSAFMSVQGRSATDLYAVGADTGAGPLVVHFDGAAWTTLDTGVSGDVWWVHPTAAGAVLVGEDGLLLEYDAATGAFTSIPGPDGITFFGAWGASDDDIWAVGGDTYGGQPPAIWRNQGGTWQPFSDPLLADHPAPSIFYKVHGTAADDVYIVGTAGILLHWDGTALSAEDSGVTSNLFTVHAGGPAPIAVGGYGQSVVLHKEGATWTNKSPGFTPQTNGVYGRGSTAVAVGAQGSVIRWDGAAWQPDAVKPTTRDLHGVYVDPDGGIWAAGGALSSTPLTSGVLVYDGPATVPGL